MAHLAVIRRGWINEHLSAFLLSKVAFVAQPAKVGDDIGSDFLCTLFVRAVVEGRDYLMPRSSFAIQVKSSGTSLDVSTQIESLHRLEVPFFVGIANIDAAELNIYSAEYLPVLLSHKGKPSKLTLRLHSERPIAWNQAFHERGEGDLELVCPLICQLNPSLSEAQVGQCGNDLGRAATRAQSHIAARAADDYVFGLELAGQPGLILAGPGSVSTFWEKFYRRLSQAFFNMIWMLERSPNEFNPREAEVFLTLLDHLEDVDHKPPDTVRSLANELRAALPGESSASPPSEVPE